MPDRHHLPTTRTSATLASRTSWLNMYTARHALPSTPTTPHSRYSSHRSRACHAERPRTHEDLTLAQTLLSRLRKQMGPRLPVQAAVPAPVGHPAQEAVALTSQTIRIPPIARAADAGVVAASPTAFDRALDRLIDELSAEPCPGDSSESPARRID